MPEWSEVLEFIKVLGWVKGVFALFFFMMHGMLFMSYRGRLADRQKEINRVAEDNREYRTRYLSMLDSHHNVKQDNKKKKGE